MPQRMLGEGIVDSDRINALTAEEEVFFYRLIVRADNFGRYDARPHIIKAYLFPLREIRPNVISSWLAALERVRLVSLYEVEGQPFLEIRKWDLHQSLRFAKVGVYPGPDGVIPGKTERTGAHQSAPRKVGALPEVKRSEENGSDVSLGAAIRKADAPAPQTETGPVIVPDPEPEIQWPPDLDDVRAEMQRLKAPVEFQDPPYWKRIDDWLGPDNSGVAYLLEFRKFLAWHDALPARRRKKNLRQAFRNWLAKAESWSENRAQRQAVREFPGSDRRR